MLELLTPAISVAVDGLLIWSGFRARRITDRFVKWTGAGLAAVPSLAKAISVRTARSQSAGGRVEGAGPDGAKGIS